MIEKNSVFLTMNELMPIVRERLEEGQTVTLTVKGVSMQPFLTNDRDSIFLISAKDRKPGVGDLYMFRRDNGSFAMHRICAVNADGSLNFVGDNQLLVEKNITPEMLWAYVPAVIRNGRKIDCEKGFWRNKMTCRMKFRLRHPDFIRRMPVIKWYLTAPFCHPLRSLRWVCKRLGGKHYAQNKKVMEKTEE